MSTFKELGLEDSLASAVEEMGWTEPTPVQVVAIPAGLEGRDIFAQAQTGTGKTGTYALTVMSRIPSGGQKPSAIVLVPTRELANQVEREVYKLSRYTHHKSIAIYGGASINDQMWKLRKGTDIVVGTPGRVKDMINRGCLDLDSITELVLDEADRMLDMGFADELDYILEEMPAEKQTLLFSATMAPEIKEIAFGRMKDPLELLVSKDEPVSDLTTQYYVQVARAGKIGRTEFVLRNGNPKTIIFCQTKRMVDELKEGLSAEFKVDAIHGDMPQARREKVIRSFRNNRFQALVATDVAARGLDVKDIDVVINYDVPPDPETYVHRIGRTGRAGKEGVAIAFITKNEDRRVRMYERETGKPIHKIRIEEMEPIEREHIEVFEDERPPRRDGDTRSRREGRPRRGRDDRSSRFERDERRQRDDRRDRRYGNNDRSGRSRYDDKPREDRPRYNEDRPRYDDQPREDRPRYDDKPREDRPRYNEDRPKYDDKPREDRPRYNEDRPRYDDKPRGDRQRYDDKPREDRPRYNEDRPRYDDKPRGDRQRYDDKPREDRPRYGDRDPKSRYDNRDRNGSNDRRSRDSRDDRSERRERLPVDKDAFVKKSKPIKSKDSNLVAIQVNLGKDDGVGRTQISEFIRNAADIGEGSVGRVGLGATSSYIEVQADKADQALRTLRSGEYRGKKIFAQVAPKKVSMAEKAGNTKTARQAGLKGTSNKDEFDE